MRLRINGALTGTCMHRVFQIWLSAILLISALPASLEAQFSYVTNNGSILITGYSGPGGAVTIPSSITGLPVTGIGNSVFKQNFNLTSITFPNTLTSIGNNTFDSCIFLKQITIPDSVTNIGTRAFQVCFNVTNVNLGNGLISIGDSAFYSLDALTELVFGTNLTSIGGHAFESCNLLSSVGIPDSVTSMGGAVFQLCEQMTNAIIGNGATSVPGNAFNGNSALKSVVIGTNATSIGSQAFGGCGLTTVTIPDSVTLIDISAFNNNASLTKVVVGSGVTSIGITAFASCSSMTGIYFKGDAPGLGTSAFSGDTATVYYLPWKSGWASTFGGLTTAAWNPPVEPALPAFQTNGFGFALVGFTSQVVIVEASTNLSGGSWVPVGTNTMTAGANFFHDDQSTNYPKRFYRLHTQ
jgi:hypothetical protein